MRNNVPELVLSLSNDLDRLDRTVEISRPTNRPSRPWLPREIKPISHLGSPILDSEYVQ